jgi:chromosome segregation ATPase
VEASLLQTVFLQNDRDLLSSLDRKGGWLDQLSQQLKPRGRANGQATIDALEAQQSRLNKQRELLKRRILRGSESIAKKQLRQMQSQLQQLNTSLESVRAELAAANSRDPEADEQQIKDLVRQAYLRTVSRSPNDHEVSTAVAYLRQAEDPVGGFRDVLWALLNTKEFIVNH